MKLKETCQLGAELVNDASVQADTESIAMAIDCFLAAGLTDFSFLSEKLNSSTD